MKLMLAIAVTILGLTFLPGCSQPKVKQTRGGTAIGSGVIDKDKVVQLMNGHRRNPLVRHEKLDAAAQGHSNWMAKNGQLSHQGASGSSASDRISKAGYQWVAIAENVAAGQRTEAEAVQSWYDSPGHRKNMQGNYQHTGVGFAQGADGVIYWTTVFANPR